MKNKSFNHIILESILGESKNIALIPGSFKPPHAGHFYAIQEISKHPNVEEIIILVGPKERNGITQEDSLQIWDIYKKYLPTNITIETSEASPIKDTIDIVGSNPQNLYILVVGYRDESDLKDLDRFKSLEGKYKNFKQLNIKGDSKFRASNLRKAIQQKDKYGIIKQIPIDLSEEDKEKVLNVLLNKVVIKELEVEGYGGVKKSHLDNYNLYNPKDVEEFYEGIKNVISEFNKLSSKEELKDPKIKENIEETIKLVSNYFNLSENKTRIIIENCINDVLRNKKGRLLPNILKESGYDGIHLNNICLIIFPGKLKPVIFEWSKYLPKIPKEKEQKFWGLHYNILSELEKLSKEVGLEGAYKELKKKFQNLESFRKKDKLEALDYFYQIIKEGKLPLNEILKIINKKVILKENQEHLKNMSLDEMIESFKSFIKEKGINIKQSYKVNLIEDEDNSKLPLPSTAYYNPNDSSINIHKTNRDNKSILKSLAHEVVHLYQDEQGKIPELTTTNINEDGDLLQLEAEAYLLGGLLFRMWEDQIKTK